jgi:hypothetical protein
MSFFIGMVVVVFNNMVMNPEVNFKSLSMVVLSGFVSLILIETYRIAFFKII